MVAVLIKSGIEPASLLTMLGYQVQTAWFFFDLSQFDNK